MHGDDYVCLSDDDGLEHIDSLLKSKYTAKDMGTLGFENSDVKAFGCWIVYSELELIKLDSTWMLNFISESRCNANTKAVSTPREKLQEKLMFRRKTKLMFRRKTESDSEER